MKKILSTIALALSLVLATPVVLPQTAVVAHAAAEAHFSEEYLEHGGLELTRRLRLKSAGYRLRQRSRTAVIKSL